MYKMATYTIKLKEYIEEFSTYEHYKDGNDMKLFSNTEKIEIGRKYLFDFDYPFYDEEKRADFEQHFIRTFYMREIGVETIGLFKFNLETWLLVNMPYYNQLFESELLEFNPLENWQVDTEHTKGITRDDRLDGKEDYTSDIGFQENQSRDTSFTGNQQSSTSEQFDGEGSEDKKTGEFRRKLHSDNPDTRLSITTRDGGGTGNQVGSGAGSGVIEYASEINEDDLAGTGHTDTQSSGSTTGNTDSEQTGQEQSNQDTVGTTGQIDQRKRENLRVGKEDEDFVESKRGKIGSKSYAEMLQEYRKSFLRIEQQIFNDMQELFMLVY